MPDEDHVRDIIRAIENIERFVRGLTFEEFIDQDIIQFAVLHQLRVVGEAARRLSGEFLIDHHNLPLIDAIGMRNALIHQYDAVDMEAVWGTANEDAPRRRESLSELFPD